MLKPGEIASGTENAAKIQFLRESLSQRSMGRLSFKPCKSKASQGEGLNGFGAVGIKSQAAQ
jgi:hypothetical protein